MAKLLFVAATSFTLFVVQFERTAISAEERRESGPYRSGEETRPPSSFAMDKAVGHLFSAIATVALTSCETLASADNTHCHNRFLRVDRESDRRNHVVAGSLVQLWQDLRTMERVHAIYVRTAENFIRRRYDNESMVNLWFETMDEALAKDSYLGHLYNRCKEERANLSLPFDHLDAENSLTADDRAVRMADNLRLKKWRVNLVFASRLSGPAGVGTLKGNEKKLEFHAAARAIVELIGSDDAYRELQRVYDESVNEVAAKIDLVDFNGKETASLLFQKLVSNIDADPTVKEKFIEKKRNVMDYLCGKV